MPALYKKRKHDLSVCWIDPAYFLRSSIWQRKTETQNEGIERMKPSLTVLFEEHQNLIKSVIWRNHALIVALHLEREDVAQDLAVAMIGAIRSFDPSRLIPLSAFIKWKLQREILNIRRRYKPHGITGLSKDARPAFLSLDTDWPDGTPYELPFSDDLSGVNLLPFLQALSSAEAEAINLRLQGYPIKRKVHITALANVQLKYAALLAERI